MKTTTILPLILGCLLHIPWESATDSCFKGEVLPPNISQINGLWNLKALAAHPTLTAKTFLNKVHYSYAKISLTEKEGTITEFFNPIEGIHGGPVSVQRVQEETLAYRKDDEEDPELFIYSQPHPDVLMFSCHSNQTIKTSALYVRSSSSPEFKLEDFIEWSKCKKLTFYKEFNVTIDYAQKCYGLLEEMKPLHLEETQDNFTSWHLLAKSSTSKDQHYNVGIFYTARLEINREENTVREIITAPSDHIIHELKFDNPTADDNFTLTFKTAEGLLLLGVRTKTGRTLYLASKTPAIRQYVMKKFQAQALCVETTYNYIIPGSIEEDDGGAKACAHNLETLVPIHFRESLGTWTLTVSASRTLQNEAYFSYRAVEITVVNDKVHLTQTYISQGTVTMEDIHVEETTGHIIYKDSPETRTAIHRVSPYCIVFSAPKGRRLFLNCSPILFPYNSDIKKFVNYAACQHFHHLLIHQSASFLCSEIPSEVHTLDVRKIVGTWRSVAAAAASAPPGGDGKFPNEIRFTVNDGEVTITDGNWTSTARKIGANRLQYTKDNNHAIEMRFHDSPKGSLLIWFGNNREQKIFLVLFSKSGHTGPEELTTFKHFAGCLSIPVVFPKE